MADCYFLVFGVKLLSVEDVRGLLEPRLNILFELRESHYRGGDYISYSGIISDSIIVESVTDENIEGEYDYTFEGYSCVLHIDNTRMSSTDNLIRSGNIKKELSSVDNFFLIRETKIMDRSS